MIPTWRERCKVLDDSHITSNADIQRFMAEEIEDLRAALEKAEKDARLLETIMSELFDHDYDDVGFTE